MNDAIQDIINGSAGHVALADDLMKLLAKGLIFLVVPLILILWFLPTPVSNHALRQRVAFVTVLGIVLALVAGMAAGHLYSDSRPFVSDPGTKQLLSHSPDNGFPSDHALVSFAVAGALICWDWIVGMVAMFAALLIGFARVFVGIHWPFDILGGAVIGLLAGGLMAQTIPWWATAQRRAASFLPAWLVTS